ncbi:MAG: 30S ribosome-binding factor RbfA [Flavobacteriaceae bacterium]|nr:30S ribosome-binding factor RbfA [Flavobacteriaceae bacterium]
MESNRQKKIAGVLQDDLATILQKTLKDAGHGNILISVTKVHVTVDLSLSKVYLSVFPSKHATTILKEINQVKSKIKHQVAQLTRHQLRRMPKLLFFNDDSLDYIEQIEDAVKGDENPIENTDLLDHRKKT